MQLWPWEDASLDEMELAYRRMRAMFEFLDKLGVDYWCFHDRYTMLMALQRKSCTAMHSDERTSLRIPCSHVDHMEVHKQQPDITESAA